MHSDELLATVNAYTELIAPNNCYIEVQIE